MPKVVITDYAFSDIEIEKGILEPLGCAVEGGQCGTTEELIDLTRDADCVITQFARVNADVIDAMEKNRVIVRYGIGVDNVDLRAAAKKSIPVCNIPDYCIDEVADHTLAMILALTRDLYFILRHVKEGTWKVPVDLNRLWALKDMTIGVVGFGRIGREVVARLTAFRPEVLVFDPVAESDEIQKRGATPATLEEIYAQSDLITLHCPSTDQTRGMINSGTIAKMKDRVLIVNLSRGDLVQTDDLVAALRAGKVAGAALDVTNPEPIPADSPLLKMDNVIITNHIASASPRAVKKLREDAAKTVVRCLQGQVQPYVVNGVKT
ncbi:MAG: C-terminal binding protein [Phycisphaerae bacterium]|nr:C-terminal binding protein [Phycisphaerae bacterium]